MISILAVILISAVWCFGYRCRGGALSIGGDFRQRIVFWSLPVGLAVLAYGLLAGMLWWAVPVALGSAVMAYVGLMFGHSEIQNGTWDNYLNGIALGAFNMLLIMCPIILYMLITHTLVVWPFIVAVSGLWQGFSYLIGYTWLKDKLDIKINGDTFLTSSVEWAEFLTPLLPAILFGLLAF